MFSLSNLIRRRRPTLELLVLQPTPLCNLDCTYCYLPNRRSRARMAPEVLEAAIRRAVESPFLGEELTVVWHAGEPLVLAPDWYEDAFARVSRIVAGRARVTHSFQTNGTRLEERWLPLLRRPDVRVGVSYDGPAHLHDARRVRLDGGGTHAVVRRGMALLRAAGVPFHVIAVVTRATLAHPEAFFDDVAGTGAFELGLNFEEQEGVNARSSLDAGAAIEAEVRTFFARLLARARASASPMRVREVDQLSALLMRPRHAPALRGGTQENEGFRIVSVGHDGSFGTWSPELLEHTDPSGTRSVLGTGPNEKGSVLGTDPNEKGSVLGTAPNEKGYVLGNVLTDSFVEAARGARFRAAQRAIDAGRARCRRECAYYEVCGGGSPSNKVAELGALDGTETRHCRITRQALAEVVLGSLERDVAAPQA